VTVHVKEPLKYQDIGGCNFQLKWKCFPCNTQMLWYSKNKKRTKACYINAEAITKHYRRRQSFQIGLPCDYCMSYKASHLYLILIAVITILGGPGSGKVTHCDNLIQEQRGIVHINMIDLLQQYSLGNGKTLFQLTSRIKTPTQKVFPAC